MRQLTDKEQSNLFITWCKETKQEIFKLETLQEYEETPGLREYQQGDLEKARSLMKQFLLSELGSIYKKMEQEGIKFRRVHIVELPLSSYLDFEIESYKISSQFGEKIFFVLKDEVNKLKKPVELQDLLIFDNEKVMLHYYDETGNWQYGAVVEESEKIK